ncbi:acyl-CoA dehydrogenase [Holophaga foetida]|uniref:acyl-CoA dehydrogenase n=1 Tax=Holophaga foetida TaxID=35839 RepID=UPI0002475355|nr:acyl-CoA dehydrogenase [Holophaga foetida]
MQFELSEENKMIQKLARQVAETYIAPSVQERDEEERFDRALFDKVASYGFQGIHYQDQYGGSGGDYLSYIIATEEIARVDVSLCIAIGGGGLGGFPIHSYGTEEQKQKYLRPLVEGTALGGFALTEPGAGSDASAQQTTAVLEGDQWVINGSKCFISNYADIYLVIAVTDRSKGLKGLSCFIVEKDTPGFTMGKKEHKMGLRSAVTTEIILQDVRVPKANLLGKEGEAFKYCMQTLDVGRIGCAAQALGIAQAALEHSIKYAKERCQFGKPIAANQGVSFMLADMATKVEAARLLTYQAAWLKQNGRPYGKQAAMAKKFTTDIAMEVTTDAVQIFGGYGYSREYPVEKLMRDAKVHQIFEGTNQIQRIVIAGNLLK